ncbi:hypothetical protein [Neptuniibacter sp. QD37_11]|uniref:hypothetical protein n=1 Tax=Neptuniibacter sp. QD37_11 TaxID=3398209 RepID=UPI0039F4A53C
MTDNKPKSKVLSKFVYREYQVAEGVLDNWEAHQNGGELTIYRSNGSHFQAKVGDTWRGHTISLTEHGHIQIGDRTIINGVGVKHDFEATASKGDVYYVRQEGQKAEKLKLGEVSKALGVLREASDAGLVFDQGFVALAHKAYDLEVVILDIEDKKGNVAYLKHIPGDVNPSDVQGMSCVFYKPKAPKQPGRLLTMGNKGEMVQIGSLWSTRNDNYKNFDIMSLEVAESMKEGFQMKADGEAIAKQAGCSKEDVPEFVYGQEKVEAAKKAKDTFFCNVAKNPEWLSQPASRRNEQSYSR